MARGITVTLSDIRAAADGDDRTEDANPLANLPEEALNGLAQEAEGKEPPEKAEAIRWAVAQEFVRRRLPEKARPLLERTLEYERGRDNPRNMAITALTLGRVLVQLDERAQASKALQEALAAARDAEEQELVQAIEEAMEDLSISGK